MSIKRPNSIPGIYLITNTANGVVYVGQARNIATRWYHHRWHLTRGTHNNQHLQRAWAKSLGATFEFTVAVDLSGAPKASLANELNRHEAMVFAIQSTTYNLLEPGLAGPITGAETRAKLAQAKKDMWARIKADPQTLASMIERSNEFRRSAEGRRQFGEATKARWADPAHHAAMSKSSRERWKHPGFRENQIAHLDAAWADPVKREERVAGLKAAWADPEIRSARLEAIKVGQDEAMKDPNGKMRLRPLKRWAAPDARTKQAAKSKETWADPEIRARRCAALKAGWAKKRAAKAG